MGGPDTWTGTQNFAGATVTGLAAQAELTATYAHPQGPWSSSTAYTPMAVVTYGGSTYRAIAGSTNVTPGTDGGVTWEAWGGGGGGGAVETVNTVASSGSAVTVPAVSVATISRVTLTANCTFTFPTATAGTSFTLALTQDGAGARVVIWPVSVKWPSGVTPVASSGAGKTDLYVFSCLNGASWYGSQVGADIR